MPHGIIIGGGVIGLGLAWELASRGEKIVVVDKQEMGRGASWAGAGILPAAGEQGSEHPLERLRTLAHQLHGEWAAKLLEQTGIDTGYQQRGGIYVARTAGETAALVAQLAEWRADGVACDELTHDQLTELEPGLTPLVQSGHLRAAAILPGEGQLRNPRFLKALRAAGAAKGVEYLEDHEVEELCFAEGSYDEGGLNHADARRCAGIVAGGKQLTADYYCLCGGAWTVSLLQQLGQPTGILPIRGQMLLYKTERPLITRVVNEGSRYLVPRDDGHLLVGSCEEEAGFQLETSESVLEELHALATGLLPQLEAAKLVNRWAGLRPGSFDTFPYMGKLPGRDNVYVSAGHFRSGLHLSPAVSQVMADLIQGLPTAVDLHPLRVGRG